MARAQTAFLNRKNLPGRPALQAAIDALGFKLTLDESYAPFETAGYLPCTLDGKDAGFDIRFRDVAADLSPALKMPSETATPLWASAGRAIRVSNSPR